MWHHSRRSSTTSSASWPSSSGARGGRHDGVRRCQLSGHLRGALGLQSTARTGPGATRSHHGNTGALHQVKREAGARGRRAKRCRGAQRGAGAHASSGTRGRGRVPREQRQGCSSAQTSARSRRSLEGHVPRRPEGNPHPQGSRRQGHRDPHAAASGCPGLAGPEPGARAGDHGAVHGQGPSIKPKHPDLCQPWGPVIGDGLSLPSPPLPTRAMHVHACSCPYHGSQGGCKGSGAAGSTSWEPPSRAPAQSHDRCMHHGMEGGLEPVLYPIVGGGSWDLPWGAPG